MGGTILGLFVFCMSLTLVPLAHAEDLTGTILDASTLQPIAGAAVTGAGKTVTTSGNGGFRLDGLKVGTVKLVIKAAGYEPGTETAQIKQGGFQGFVAVLFPEGFAGETIEVKSKAPPLAIDPPGRQDLKREEIVRIPGARGDALQTLRNMPGVSSANGQGPGASDLVIRGAAPEDSIILLDGIEVPLVYHFFGLQSILPSEFIDNIDFMPGGFDVERGRATGGVVDIKTRNQEPQEASGFAELSFINLAALAQGPISKKHKLYVTGAVRRSTIDFILPAVLGEDSDVSFQTAPTYYDAQLRLDWRPTASDAIAVLGVYSYDQLKLLNDGIDPNEPLFTGSFKNTTSFLRFITTWRHESGPIQSRLSASVGTTDFGFELPGDRYLRFAGPRVDVREDFSWAPIERLRLRFGGDVRLVSSDLDVRLPLPPQEGEGGMGNYSSAAVLERNTTLKNHAASAYLATDLKPHDKTTITTGLRFDYYNHLEAKTWSPRVSVKQGLSDRLALQATIGAYTRPLDQYESVQTNLDAERATQYVFGAEYQIREGLQASSNAFYTDRHDLIVQDAILAETDPNNAYLNRGYGRSFGLEALVRAKFDNFFGWVSYTISRSDRYDAPNTPRRLFDYDQTHNFIAVGSYKLGSWQFGGRFQYYTGLPITPVAFATYLADLDIHVPTYGEVNSDRKPDGHQLDIRIDKIWTFKNKFQLSMYLDITNVYYHPATLDYQYNLNYTERQAIKDIPIFPALGVRGTFL
jgi:outer membrane cobalamin receptor